MHHAAGGDRPQETSAKNLKAVRGCVLVRSGSRSGGWCVGCCGAVRRPRCALLSWGSGRSEALPAADAPRAARRKMGGCLLYAANQTTTSPERTHVAHHSSQRAQSKQAHFRISLKNILYIVLYSIVNILQSQYIISHL